jgi:hypothetical protein
LNAAGTAAAYTTLFQGADKRIAQLMRPTIE